MKKFFSKKNEQGFSIIDVAIAMFISSIVALGLTAAFHNSGLPMKRANLNESALAVRAMNIKLLTRYLSWYQTVIIQPGVFTCAELADGSCTNLNAGTAAGNFTLFDDNAVIIYDPTDTTQGFGSGFDGIDRVDTCTATTPTASPVAPDLKCPIRVDYRWYLVSDPSVSPVQIKIEGTISVWDEHTKAAVIKPDLGFTVLKSFYTTACDLNGTSIPNLGTITAYRYPYGQTSGDCGVFHTRTCRMGRLDGSYGYNSCGCDTPWGATVPSGGSVTAYSAPTHASCATISEVRTCGTNTGVLGGTFTYGTCNPGASCLSPHLPPGTNIADGGTVESFQYTIGTPTCISQVRTCNAGTLSAVGTVYTNATCTACEGKKYGVEQGTADYCWYYGGKSASCDAACSTHGGCVLAGILAYGSGGSNARCIALAAAFGKTNPFIAGTAQGTGCLFDISGSDRVRRATGATTCAAKNGKDFRFCSCAK